MAKALIGTYYKTFEAATEAFNKMPEYKQKNHSIVEFDNAYLIVSNEQIKKLQ